MGAARRWLLGTPEGEVLRVHGQNWIVAIGNGLATLGALTSVEQLAVSREGEEQFCVVASPSGRRYMICALDTPLRIEEVA